jgi:hypothetical protein
MKRRPRYDDAYNELLARQREWRMMSPAYRGEEPRYVPPPPPPKKRGICDLAGSPWMTPSRYRELMRRQGKPVPRGCDVCHIVAKSNGGADHVDNYIIGCASLNRSIGNRDDSVFAKMAGLQQTRRAVKVSIRVGYMGPSAEELCL